MFLKYISDLIDSKKKQIKIQVFILNLNGPITKLKLIF